MDRNDFFVEDNTYKIRISKKLKFFSLSKFGQYDCLIEFIDSMNNPILQINCTEKELLCAILRISEFSSNIIYGSPDMMIDNDNIMMTIPFGRGINSNSFTNFFIYLYTTNLDTFENNYPIEHDIVCELCIYSSNLGKNILRLCINFTYSFLEELIFEMYKILEDIPYFAEMNNQITLDFLNGDNEYE